MERCRLAANVLDIFLSQKFSSNAPSFNCFKVGQSFHVLFLIYDGFCTQWSVSSFAG